MSSRTVLYAGQKPMDVGGKAFQEYWGLLRKVLKDKVDTEEIIFSKHSIQRMQERGITRFAVDKILKSGTPPTEMYKPFDYPYGDAPYKNDCPVFTVVGKHSGIPIGVGLAVSQDKRGLLFTVCTVMDLKNNSRHAHRVK